VIAPLYVSALGKNANCQVVMSLILASSKAPVMIGLRLFLLEGWTSCTARKDRAMAPA
jgi:hypothetical protein